MSGGCTKDVIQGQPLPSCGLVTHLGERDSVAAADVLLGLPAGGAARGPAAAATSIYTSSLASLNEMML